MELLRFLHLRGDEQPHDVEAFARYPRTWGEPMRDVIERTSLGSRAMVASQALDAVEVFRDVPRHWTRSLISGIPPEMIAAACTALSRSGSGPRSLRFLESPGHVHVRYGLDDLSRIVVLAQICLQEGLPVHARGVMGSGARLKTTMRALLTRASPEDLPTLAAALDGMGYKRAKQMDAVMHGSPSGGSSLSGIDTERTQVLTAIGDAPADQREEIARFLDEVQQSTFWMVQGPGLRRDQFAAVAESIRHRFALRENSPTTMVFSAP